MPQRFAATVNLPVALGLGCFLAWKEALVAFLYPVSNGLVFSPLVCQSLAGCFVLVVAFAGVVRNRAGFPLRFLVWTASGMVALATAASVVITTGAASDVVAYGGSVVIGATSAALLYAWAEVLAGLTVRGRTGPPWRPCWRVPCFLWPWGSSSRLP